MWARIEQNKIQEITDIDPSERFHPDIVWASLSEDPDAAIGWSAYQQDGRWIFSAPEDPVVDLEGLARAARDRREMLLRKVYDPGILMALRALRMATGAEQAGAAQAKVIELDNYAVALQGIPAQEGFPLSIVWPEEPTKSST